MKKLASGLMLSGLVSFMTLNASAQTGYSYDGLFYGGDAGYSSHAAMKKDASHPDYSTDYVSCTRLAAMQTRELPDTMYLGIFYGCMKERGYDPEVLN